MKLIYVAGAYRAKTEWELEQNIRAAEKLALEVWWTGNACICPHKNTAHFGGAATDELWLKGDIEIMSRCDAVVCVEGWENSNGAMHEIKYAMSLGLPVCYSMGQLVRWLEAK